MSRIQVEHTENFQIFKAFSINFSNVQQHFHYIFQIFQIFFLFFILFFLISIYLDPIEYPHERISAALGRINNQQQLQGYYTINTYINKHLYFIIRL